MNPELNQARDVVLVIGVPITFSQFVARVRASDWLSKFDEPDADGQAWETALASRWAREYLPFVAKPLQELIRQAAEMKMDVVTEATLPVLGEATRTHQVVVLFAHWKGPELVNDDIVAPGALTEFAKRAERAQDLRGQWLRRRLQDLIGNNANVGNTLSGWLRWGSQNKATTLRDVLAEAVVHGPDEAASPKDGIDVVAVSDVVRLAKNREYMNDLFQGLLRPGNRAELYDGLHSKESIEAALPPGFDGVLDLVLCNSAVPAEYIGSRAKHRFRLVESQTAQDFLWSSHCVGLACRLYLEQQLSYLQARLLAGSILEAAVNDVSKRSTHLKDQS
jgi:hypothetical protein